MPGGVSADAATQLSQGVWRVRGHGSSSWQGLQPSSTKCGTPGLKGMQAVRAGAHQRLVLLGIPLREKVRVDGQNGTCSNERARCVRQRNRTAGHSRWQHNRPAAPKRRVIQLGMPTAEHVGAPRTRRASASLTAQPGVARSQIQNERRGEPGGGPFGDWEQACATGCRFGDVWAPWQRGAPEQASGLPGA